jgi:hypothetical protein
LGDPQHVGVARDEPLPAVLIGSRYRAVLAHVTKRIVEMCAQHRVSEVEVVRAPLPTDRAADDR